MNFTWEKFVSSYAKICLLSSLQMFTLGLILSLWATVVVVRVLLILTPVIGARQWKLNDQITLHLLCFDSSLSSTD